MTKQHNNQMPKKTEFIKFRVDSAMRALIKEKAQNDFDGQVSDFLRCAAMTYTAEKIAPSQSDNQIIGLLTSIDKQQNRTGVNVNQVAKCINEKMKLSPYAFSANDLLPFSQFCKELKTVQEMYRSIHDLLTK